MTGILLAVGILAVVVAPMLYLTRGKNPKYGKDNSSNGPYGDSNPTHWGG